MTDGVSDMIDDTAVEILEFCNDHDVNMEVTYLSMFVIYTMSKKTSSGRTCKVSVQLSSTDLIANNECDMAYILDKMFTKLNEQVKQTEDFKNDNT